MFSVALVAPRLWWHDIYNSLVSDSQSNPSQGDLDLDTMTLVLKLALYVLYANKKSVGCMAQLSME